MHRIKDLFIILSDSIGNNLIGVTADKLHNDGIQTMIIHGLHGPAHVHWT
jgi:hypothetical protein